MIKKEFKYAKTEMFTTMQNCEGGFRRERLEKRKIGLRPWGGGEGGWDPEQRRVLRQRISETDGDISSHPSPAQEAQQPNNFKWYNNLLST